MLKKLIFFLVRKKLKIKKFEAFRFENQTSKTDFYFFGDEYLVKVECILNENNDLLACYSRSSNVSLNWLLNDYCKIIKVDRDKIKNMDCSAVYSCEKCVVSKGCKYYGGKKHE